MSVRHIKIHNHCMSSDQTSHKSQIAHWTASCSPHLSTWNFQQLLPKKVGVCLSNYQLFLVMNTISHTITPFLRLINKQLHLLWSAERWGWEISIAQILKNVFCCRGSVSMENNELVYTFSWWVLCLPSHTVTIYQPNYIIGGKNTTKQKYNLKGKKPGRRSSKSSWETSAFKHLLVLGKLLWNWVFPNYKLLIITVVKLQSSYLF